MTASIKTIKAIHDVLVKHLESRQITKVLSDLQDVDGNRSFEDTINALVKCHTDYVIAKHEGKLRVVK